MKTCYMCEKPSTSDEHAPPQCLFPEQKDVADGKDYRVNLITVPACDEHNLRKSKDDEYLMVVIAAHFENNRVAFNQVSSKILRAMKRNNLALAGRILKGMRPAVVKGKRYGVLTVETNRIGNELGKIGRAIYYDHFKEKWMVPLIVSATGLVSEDVRINERLVALREVTNRAFANLEKFGENQEVFFYQIFRRRGEYGTVIRLVFYEGFEAIVTETEGLP